MPMDLYGKNPMLWERLSITSPPPCSSISCQQFENSNSGSLYTKEVGRHYKLGLYFFPLLGWLLNIYSHMLMYPHSHCCSVA